MRSTASVMSFCAEQLRKNVLTPFWHMLQVSNPLQMILPQLPSPVPSGSCVLRVNSSYLWKDLFLGAYSYTLETEPWYTYHEKASKSSALFSTYF